MVVMTTVPSVSSFSLGSPLALVSTPVRLLSPSDDRREGLLAVFAAVSGLAFVSFVYRSVETRGGVRHNVNDVVAVSCQ